MEKAKEAKKTFHLKNSISRRRIETQMKVDDVHRIRCRWKKFRFLISLILVFHKWPGRVFVSFISESVFYSGLMIDNEFVMEIPSNTHSMPCRDEGLEGIENSLIFIFFLHNISLADNYEAAMLVFVILLRETN